MHDSRKPKRWLRLILAATAVAVTAVAVGNVHHPVPASAAVRDVAPVVPEPRSVGWVGDSIGWQSHQEIESAVSRTHRLSTFNSILGATVDYQTAATHDVVLGPHSPDILLVELGTNDTGKVEPAQFADDIRRFLDGVTPHVKCVRWFDLKRGGSSVYQTFNENAQACWIAGFSFGAWIGMQLLMRRPEITGFISVAPPANLYDFSFLAPCPSSGLVITGDQDEIVPVDVYVAGCPPRPEALVHGILTLHDKVRGETMKPWA